MSIHNYLQYASDFAKRIHIIGQSVLGRNIIAFTKGDNTNVKVLIHGSIHARENITGRLITDLISSYKGDAEIWFVPYVNPDGVMLVQDGLNSVPPWRHKALINYNNNRDNFSLWKANINGVDLNVNFDAQWGSGLSNIRYPFYENYIGPYAFSERESRALRDLSIKEKFILTISYHTKGKEIYWGFDNNYKYEEEALLFSHLTGYPLKKSIGSAGGYKDWYTLYSEGLGLTIEAGDDSYDHPLDDKAYNSILKDNKHIANLASEVASKLYEKQNW